MGIALLALAACNDSAPMQMQNGDAPSGGSGSNVIHDAPTADVPGGVGEPAELMGMTLYHNQVRAMVDTTNVAGGPLPSMQWDPNLASYAAAWAAQCQSANGQLLDHDPNRTNVAGYAYIGENIYASGGTATAQGAVQLWASEGQYYTYSTNTCASGHVCGHYTQLVWRASLHVGCALQNCPSLAYPSTIVCDYGPGGNYGGQAPY